MSSVETITYFIVSSFFEANKIVIFKHVPCAYVICVLLLLLYHCLLGALRWKCFIGFFLMCLSAFPLQTHASNPR